MPASTWSGWTVSRLQGAVGRLLGQRYAQVKDPDGNVVNLIAPMGEEARAA